jgi:hypothetical protein
MPRPTATEPQETSMTTQTNDWRDFDDRDAHQDRIAADTSTDW